MRNDIREKLQVVLSKPILEETDVVYILSRVRKLLELDKEKSDFKFLKFFCNWALHSQIDDTDVIRKILEKPGEAVFRLMHVYPDLDKDLKKFLKKYKLTTDIFSSKKSVLQFHHLLSAIHTDTPLIIKTTSKKKITFRKIESFGQNSGVFDVNIEPIN